MDLLDRFTGCLLGGAVGDALGAPVEFLSIDDIRSRFGRDGIIDFAPSYGRRGAITDDTQMTLFTAEGVIRAHIRHSARGICHWPTVIGNAYGRWLLTQQLGTPASWAAQFDCDGLLFGIAALHSRRAPGRTCVHALSTTSPGTRASNGSKGCGGVMRVAPVGLLGSLSGGAARARETFELACEAAALTHGHPTGYIAAGAFAVMVRQLALGESLLQAVAASRQLLLPVPDHRETLQALDEACELAATDPAADIAQLGAGWIAEEALAMGLFAALVARDFRSGVVRAVNHSGDSDSTGSIAGNLLGVMHGSAGIPPQWLADLELRDEIGAVARDLHDIPRLDFDALAPERAAHARAFELYPGH